MARLEVKIGNMTLKNPVMTASGTAGYGEELSGFFDISALGALVVKGISLKPMGGNPPPRICETSCGMINSIGLQNVGLKVFLKEKLPPLRDINTNIIVNILGNTVAEYVRLASELDNSGGVDGIELNVSCPNVKKGGLLFGTDKKAMTNLIKKVRETVKNSALIVKLSPGAPSIKDFASAAEDSGADAVSLINTIPAMSIDINTRRPRIKNIIGGLSGPAIKPIALRMVWEASNAVKIPVIGIGGIINSDDAIEFILAGAMAVAVGTGIFLNPLAPVDIIKGIEDYLGKNNMEDINELIGGMIACNNPDH